jgi:hypothetical protein
VLLPDLMPLEAVPRPPALLEVAPRPLENPRPKPLVLYPCDAL